MTYEFVVYNRCSFVLAFVLMWLIDIRFHISQSKERDKLSLSAIIISAQPHGCDEIINCKPVIM